MEAVEEVPEVAVMLKGPALVVAARVAFHWQVLLPGVEMVKFVTSI